LSLFALSYLYKLMITSHLFISSLSSLSLISSSLSHLSSLLISSSFISSSFSFLFHLLISFSSLSMLCCLYLGTALFAGFAVALLVLLLDCTFTYMVLRVQRHSSGEKVRCTWFVCDVHRCVYRCVCTGWMGCTCVLYIPVLLCCTKGRYLCSVLQLPFPSGEQAILYRCVPLRCVLLLCVLCEAAKTHKDTDNFLSR
jgi:hypothetical protein